MERRRIEAGTGLIGEVPALFRWPAGARRLPLVILSHGFTMTKESFAQELDAYAARGCFALAIDNAGHGARVGPGFREAAFRGDRLDILGVRKLIEATARGVPGLIDRFAADPRVDPGKVAIAGISMGGYVVYRALTLEPRIKVAAAMIASPVWEDLPGGIPLEDGSETLAELEAYCAERSPDRFIDRFADRRLLIQLGGDDVHFSNAKVRRFAERLRPTLAAGGAVELVVHPGVAHDCPPAMRERTMEWIIAGFRDLDGGLRA